VQSIIDFFLSIDPITLWITLFVIAGISAGILSGYFKARKIQPGTFRWKAFRREIFYAVITVTVAAFIIGSISKYFQSVGIIQFNHEPAPWWVIALEFTLYFVGFDTWFYWLHRLMHKEPFYKWIHKLHHGSIAPNLMTTFSVSPIESVINGGWVIVFTSLLTVHDTSMLCITPFNVLMGLYVHSGHEFLPSWWNKSWATKWFISATFHDQHHRYFKGNYGGYTTIWDRLCGTMRPHYEADFTKVTTRPIRPAKAAPQAEAQAG